MNNITIQYTLDKLYVNLNNLLITPHLSNTFESVHCLGNFENNKNFLSSLSNCQILHNTFAEIWILM